MNVVLLSKTDNPLQAIYLAAKRCQCSDENFFITDNMSEFVKRVIACGHTSVLEHASFTFSVEGVSRALTHQLVRHRMASYAQCSQRYVPFNLQNAIIPESIINNTEAADAFSTAMNAIEAVYVRMQELGIPLEDARYIMPNAAPTSLVVTMNCRELYDTFFPLRCCNRAQWEIRNLANKMLSICKTELPTMFENAGASCVRYGKCPEGARSCKKEFIDEKTNV